MPVMMDLRVAELLCSRLCHDLVSPVGAVNNGIEFLDGVDAATMAEATQLIARSAEEAAHRLSFFRLAYGAAGSEVMVDMKDARRVTMAMFGEGRYKLDWPEEQPSIGVGGVQGLSKVLINLVQLAAECLPSGGTMHVHGGQTDGRLALCVTAIGKNAALREGGVAALAGETAPEKLDARSIQAFITGRFADQFGLKISTEEWEGKLSFIIVA